MRNSGSFAAFEESIKKGWFNQQWSELVSSLEALEAEGRLTPGEREQLLRLARELRIYEQSSGSSGA
jgi:hypothetical protein